MHGKIKWFNNKKGYGFIINEDGDDIFVHYSDIVSKNKFKKLYTNNEVIFDIYVDEHNFEKAINVRLVDNENKAYIVYESWNTCNDSSPIAIFLDEKKCDDFIREKNKDWEKDNRMQNECIKCRGCDKDEYGDAKDNTFKLKDICGRANIGIDRNGMYCENDVHNYHDRSSNHYTKYEVDLFN